LVFALCLVGRVTLSANERAVQLMRSPARGETKTTATVAAPLAPLPDGASYTARITRAAPGAPLGFSVTFKTSASGNRVIVKHVEQAIAESTGMQTGDVLLSADGCDATGATPAELIAMLSKDQVTLVLQRQVHAVAPTGLHKGARGTTLSNHGTKTTTDDLACDSVQQRPPAAARAQSEEFVVTIERPDPLRPHLGFTLAFKARRCFVSSVSSAKTGGTTALQLGDELIAINGTPLISIQLLTMAKLASSMDVPRLALSIRRESSPQNADCIVS
jgi:predicted metalloprotease with PDZ domain